MTAATSTRQTIVQLLSIMSDGEAIYSGLNRFTQTALDRM